MQAMVQAVVVVVAVLSAGLPLALGSCNRSTQVEVHGRCCDQCPPGTFMATLCDVHSPTQCEPCPQGTFSEKFSLRQRCKFCTHCVTALDQVEIDDCTPTRDRRCGCEEDNKITRLSMSGTLFWCCPNCPAGTEAQNECSFDDFLTPCSSCPPGTFSGGGGARCENCTHCRSVRSPCTNTSDTVCSGPDQSASGRVIAVAVGVPGLLLLLVVAAAVWMILRNRRTCAHNNDRLPGPSAGARGGFDKQSHLVLPLNSNRDRRLSTSSSSSSGTESETSASVLLSQNPYQK